MNRLRATSDLEIRVELCCRIVAVAAALAVLWTALQAPLLLTGMTALAANKVEAMVVVKGIGALMVLCPVAAGLLPSPWNLLLLPLPPTWPALALPGYDPGPLGTWALLLGGLVVTAVALTVCLRRTVHRIGRGDTHGAGTWTDEGRVAVS